MGIMSYIKDEIRVIRERDPAIKSNMEVFLYPSFKAILRYRVAHSHSAAPSSLSVSGVRQILSSAAALSRLINAGWNREFK